MRYSRRLNSRLVSSIAWRSQVTSLVMRSSFIGPTQSRFWRRRSPSETSLSPPRPDFAAAATKLGVTEAQLKAALGVPANPPNPGDRSQRPPRPDFAAAATKLGVTEAQLKAALGVPPHPPSDGGASPQENRPNQP